MSITELGKTIKGELIVDAHAHVGTYHNFHIPFAEWEHSKETATQLNFAHIIASSTRAIANDAVLGNNELLTLVDRESGLLIPYLVFKPNSPDYLKDLTKIAESRSIRNFKLHDDGNNLSYDHKGYDEFYEWANSKKAIILFHTFGKIQLEPIMRVAAQYSKITCLLAHSGIVDEHLYIDAALKHENIYLELANSWAWFGLIERLVKGVGSERIIFGSDMPFLSPEQQLGRIVMARISDQSKRQILGLNAKRLFQL